LFVGDSLTYVNNLEKRVAALARTAGVSELVVEREVKGGAPLKVLWQKTKAEQIIASGGPWDVVVIQEDLPETDLETFQEFADKFHSASLCAGSKTVLLSCAGYERLGWITTEGIAEAHDTASARLGCAVAHAGRAWLRAKQARPELELYSADKEHPSFAGTVLSAAVVFSSLWGSPAPEGTGSNALPPEWGLTREDITFLHQIAWESVVHSMNVATASPAHVAMRSGAQAAAFPVAPLVCSPTVLFCTWLEGSVPASAARASVAHLFEDILRIIRDALPTVPELPQGDLHSMAAAPEEDSDAMVEIADRYTWGSLAFGVRCDSSLAAMWFDRAAQLRNPNAKSSLAVLYWKGQGVPKDRFRACQLEREAVQDG
jgi:hypothetical protein